MDPQIWRSIAGGAKIPAVGSLVYYFPQGHVEHSSSPPNFSSISISRLFSLCQISSVDYLADPESDEVFAKIHLSPKIVSPICGRDSPAQDSVSFSKILTQSDANNGGGFSVPRLCADSIFPKLDLKDDPPVQNLSITDVHGKSWEFRHIYRGVPRRHLLTTGWSKFVNSKKLVAGDSVVFVKDRDGKLFVGIRRTRRMCRILGEEIVETIKKMEMGCGFEVLYYPRVGLVEFVVEKETVERAVGFDWREGMRVKMAVETEDSSRVVWVEGTIKGDDEKDSMAWPCSPWRMLQVTWDEPQVLQNVSAVSPWQVELLPPSLHMQTPFPAMKKLRVPHWPDIDSDEFGHFLFPSTLTDSTKMANLTSLFNHQTFPAGMQGARHDFDVQSLSSFVHRNTHLIFSDNGINMPEDLNKSQLEAASSPIQESVENHNLELLGVAAGNPTRKVGKGSFQLFGKIIYMDLPNDNNSSRDYVENEGVRTLEISLPTTQAVA